MNGGKWVPASLVAGVCFGIISVGPLAQAATLDPLPLTIVAGGTTVVTLNDNIDAGDGIEIADLIITFDASLLTLTSVANGSLLVNWLAPVSHVTTVDSMTHIATESISLSEDAFNLSSLDAAGQGSVVSLTFTALAADPTTMTELTASTTPTSGTSIYQLAKITNNVGITAATVTPPTTVPEPGTIALLLAPMLAAASFKRRDRC